MPVTQEIDFAERLLADDEQVLADVLRMHGPVIRVVLCRRYQGLLAESDIDDVLSIGLFRLWNSRESFDQRKGKLRVWFFRIVENAARDVLRMGWQRARQLEVSTSPSQLASMVDHRRNGNRHTTPSQPVSEVQIEVRKIVDGLPKVQRQIVLAFALARDDSTTSQSLGEELDIPASTVRVYRKRAMDTIRDELIRCGYEISE